MIYLAFVLGMACGCFLGIMVAAMCHMAHEQGGRL